MLPQSSDAGSPRERQRSSVWLDFTEQDANQCGLACAVSADQGNFLVRLDPQRGIFQDDVDAKRNGNSRGREERRHGRPADSVSTLLS